MHTSLRNRCQGSEASLSFLETICLQDRLLCSSLNTTRGPACQGSTPQPSCPAQSHAVVKKAGRHTVREHHSGCFISSTDVGVILVFPSCLVSPPFHGALLVMCPVDMAGWSNGASLSTGIYERRNKPALLPIVVGTHSSWKHSVV